MDIELSVLVTTPYRAAQYVTLTLDESEMELWARQQVKNQYNEDLTVKDVRVERVNM